jgi:hypothetical protein
VGAPRGPLTSACQHCAQSLQWALLGEGHVGAGRCGRRADRRVDCQRRIAEWRVLRGGRWSVTGTGRVDVTQAAELLLDLGRELWGDALMGVRRKLPGEAIEAGAELGELR